MQRQLPAIIAYVYCRDRAIMRQAATLTEWRFDKPHALPARHTYEALGNRRSLHPANLADFGINESQPDVQPVFGLGDDGVHTFTGLGFAAGRRTKMTSASSR